jgi:flavodoxin
MKVVVVYESLWGNTEAIAEQVAQGFLEAGEDIEVAVRRAGEATPSDLADVDLLVAGAPTHMCGMSSARSRRMGLSAKAKKADSAGPAAEAEGPGIRDWLKALPEVSGRSAASFDTRIEHRFAGGAGRGIARRLRRRGYQLRGEPTGFIVIDTAGPLKDGERDRARRWAHEVLTLSRRPAGRGMRATPGGGDA